MKIDKKDLYHIIVYFLIWIMLSNWYINSVIILILSIVLTNIILILIFIYIKNIKKNDENQ